MSSVLEMLRLRCRWDFQFIFNTHENTLAIPVPELCRAENVNHSFCEDPHKLRELVCQEGQHGCEGTQSGSEENEEGKLLLRVN